MKFNKIVLSLLVSSLSIPGYGMNEEIHTQEHGSNVHDRVLTPFQKVIGKIPENPLEIEKISSLYRFSFFLNEIEPLITEITWEEKKFNASYSKKNFLSLPVIDITNPQNKMSQKKKKKFIKDQNTQKKRNSTIKSCFIPTNVNIQDMGSLNSYDACKLMCFLHPISISPLQDDENLKQFFQNWQQENSTQKNFSNFNKVLLTMLFFKSNCSITIKNGTEKDGYAYSYKYLNMKSTATSYIKTFENAMDWFSKREITTTEQEKFIKNSILQLNNMKETVELFTLIPINPIKGRLMFISPESISKHNMEIQEIQEIYKKIQTDWKKLITPPPISHINVENPQTAVSNISVLKEEEREIRKKNEAQEKKQEEKQKKKENKIKKIQEILEQNDNLNVFTSVDENTEDQTIHEKIISSKNIAELREKLTSGAKLEKLTNVQTNINEDLFSIRENKKDRFVIWETKNGLQWKYLKNHKYNKIKNLK